MSAVITVSGHITPEGGLVIDEPVPLPAGPVRVSLRSAGAEGLPASRWEVDEEHAREMKEMRESAIGCLSDEEAARILRIVEEEFEQVEPDEWN